LPCRIGLRLGDPAGRRRAGHHAARRRRVASRAPAVG
jgi:hypothetical protein